MNEEAKTIHSTFRVHSIHKSFTHLIFWVLQTYTSTFVHTDSHIILTWRFCCFVFITYSSHPPPPPPLFFFTEWNRQNWGRQKRGTVQSITLTQEGKRGKAPERAGPLIETHSENSIYIKHRLLRVACRRIKRCQKLSPNICLVIWAKL